MSGFERSEEKPRDQLSDGLRPPDAVRQQDADVRPLRTSANMLGADLQAQSRLSLRKPRSFQDLIRGRDTRVDQGRDTRVDQPGSMSVGRLRKPNSFQDLQAERAKALEAAKHTRDKNLEALRKNPAKLKKENPANDGNTVNSGMGSMKFSHKEMRKLAEESFEYQVEFIDANFSDKAKSLISKPLTAEELAERKLPTPNIDIDE